jgi:hypothetical protein
MSDERPNVILALTPLAEREVESLLFDESDAKVTLTSSVAEADDLARAIEDERPDAILLSCELSGITPAHCARAKTAGVRIVGLALDGQERDALKRLGVDSIIDSTASGVDLLAAIRGAPDAAEPPPAVPPTKQRTERGDDAGSVLAVIGAKGAPGASECAASLTALAARRWPSLLVEIDALGGGLDVRLGADPTQGSILGLVRAAAEGAVQRELVERWIMEPAGWPPVLLGPPDPKALIDLVRPGAIARALDALAALYPLTVCDVGALLADGYAASGLHREVLIAADAVLLVLGARDIQLRHGLAQLDLLLGTLGIPSERLRVIANGIGGPGSAGRSAITATITGHLAERGVTVDAWLPWDTRGLKRARRRGTPLTVARTRSRYVRSLTALLSELFLPASPTPKGRKRRLASPDQPAQEQIAWQR